MSKSKNKYLVINADDFGLNSDINKAVLNSYLKGCVTSTGLFAVASDKSFNQAVEILKMNKNLDFSIQVVLISDCLSEFKPLSKATSITHNGFFYKNPLRWTWALSQKKFRPQIKKEIKKQIEKVLKTGLKPSYLNSHYYATELPGLTDILIDLARQYNIKAIRNPYEEISFKNLFLKPNKFIKAKMINILSATNRKKLIKKNILIPDYYYGVYDSGKIDKNCLLNILKNLKPGLSELLIHPSMRNSPHFYEKDQYKALISKEINNFIKKNNIILTTYRDYKVN